MNHCVKYVYQQNVPQHHYLKSNCFDLNLTNTDLVDLDVATKGQLFQFNGALYEHTDSVAMGSPLGPLLTYVVIVFMASIEENFEREN